MIFEIAEIEVAEGSQAAFEAAVSEALPLFREAAGCRSMKLERGIESPTRYLLVVCWDTVEDHMVGFRESAAFQQWRALAGPHFAAPPRVQHVETVVAGF
ncbi:antibiotic biosynthesis monooxygenase [Sphingomonas sp. AOB5]|uniref:antibiotic biosynthesis monooxygenase family protein n=1 Tax=Sphingomonas sp. AOB5 TaxID=3034017 RepID=UPI0023F6F127|nr:antibiotic biosynthesis monooxygenase family protein [Sphingomonas sp. AOB5]MDF7776084.1 antibiotic biosynthesis monooxygenase [Sphingomonas sp. AOB5]